MFFEIGLQTHQDLDRIFHRRLVDVDLLEAARQGAVFFEMLAEFFISGRSHATQFAALQRGFEQVGCIHRPTRCGACANHGVNLVDEQDRVGMVFHLFDNSLQPLFKIAAIAGARQQSAHVERVNRSPRQNLGRLALHDLAGQAFGNGGFANSRITHQKGIVLASAAQNLNGALYLGLAADQGVNIALHRLVVQINTILRKRGFFGFARFGLGRFVGLISPRNRTRFAERGVFGHAVGDVIHRVIARHILLLQEEGGV